MTDWCLIKFIDSPYMLRSLLNGYIFWDDQYFWTANGLYLVDLTMRQVV